ncbi:MAG: hypothetical protein GY816_21265 [Cytophagales bacterium]|nr:hypothetical protein [Cytophagales bacterium]
MKKLKVMTMIGVLFMALMSSCGDDNFEELKINDPVDTESTDGDGNEGGGGGTNKPPSID